MRHRETLDEAIDRVASQMTSRDSGADIAPVWHELPSHRWRGWQFAATTAAAAFAVGIAVAVMQWAGPRVEERTIDSQPLVAWSSLQASLSESRPEDSGAVRRIGTPEGVPYTSERAPSATNQVPSVTEGVASAIERVDDRNRRPAWGIPFIDAPTALDVAAQSTPPLGIDTVGISDIDIAPLSIDGLDRDRGTAGSKEQ